MLDEQELYANWFRANLISTRTRSLAYTARCCISAKKKDDANFTRFVFLNFLFTEHTESPDALYTTTPFNREDSF